MFVFHKNLHSYLNQILDFTPNFSIKQKCEEKKNFLVVVEFFETKINNL